MPWFLGPWRHAKATHDMWCHIPAGLTSMWPRAMAQHRRERARACACAHDPDDPSLSGERASARGDMCDGSVAMPEVKSGGGRKGISSVGVGDSVGEAAGEKASEMDAAETPPLPSLPSPWPSTAGFAGEKEPSSDEQPASGDLAAC
eukprot:3451211-Pleurochrysis_carterae.AAC.2